MVWSDSNWRTIFWDVSKAFLGPKNGCWAPLSPFTSQVYKWWGPPRVTVSFVTVLHFPDEEKTAENSDLFATKTGWKLDKLKISAYPTGRNKIRWFKSLKNLKSSPLLLPPKGWGGVSKINKFLKLSPFLFPIIAFDRHTLVLSTCRFARINCDGLATTGRTRTGHPACPASQRFFQRFGLITKNWNSLKVGWSCRFGEMFLKRVAIFETF